MGAALYERYGRLDVFLGNAAILGTLSPVGHIEPDVFDRVTHGHATSEGGVKIHYASLGEGPLVVMIHGFPDFWYSWRHKMAALSDRFQVVAIDQRGYNLSDKPTGVESYDMRLLVTDVAAVIKQLGRDKATIVGHDWGGAVAWQFAIALPQMTENLIILNLHHPNGLLRELRTNKEQIKNSEYARNFQTKSPSDPTIFFGLPMTPQTLSSWVRDPAARTRGHPRCRPRRERPCRAGPRPAFVE